MSLKLPTYFVYTDPDVRRGEPYAETHSDGHTDHNVRGKYQIGEIITFKDDGGRWAHEILDVDEGIPPDGDARHWIVKLGPVIPTA